MSFYSLISQGGADADAQAYISAAGITSSTEKNAVTKLFKRLKAINAWSSIVDLGLALGGTIANAKVKAKGPVGFTSMVDQSAVAMTNTNYVANQGIRNTATTKRLSTGIIPTNHGLNYNNITMMLGMTDAINSTSVYSMLDNDPTAATAYIRKDVIGINPGISYSPPLRTLTPYIHTITSNGSAVFMHDWNQHNSPVVVPTPNIDTEISIFGGKIAGADVFSTGAYAFHLIASYLTPAQCSDITTFIHDFWTEIGRKSATKDNVCFGDSITLGVGSTGVVSRYSYLLAQANGLVEQPCGVHTSELRQANGTVLGGYDRRGILQKYNILGGGKVYIQYGVNDCSSDSGSVNHTDFRDKLILLVNELLAYGVLPQNIIIGSMSIINISAAPLVRQQLYVAAARQAAVSTGVYYADVWQYMKDNGDVATLLSDTKHPNNAGHLAMKTALLTAGPV